MVHFSRSAGFVLYLIYLIDRKKNGEKVDTLNIVQYKQLFGKLYEMVYGYNGETIFTDIVKNYNAEGEMRQKGLYTVLKAFGRMLETPVRGCKSQQSHSFYKTRQHILQCCQNTSFYQMR